MGKPRFWCLHMRAYLGFVLYEIIARLQPLVLGIPSCCIFMREAMLQLIEPIVTEPQNEGF